jgi:renalase
MNIKTCLVIGAGISGLLAARHLHREGQKVVVLDKGRGLGGRMATRRFGPGVFDHGAQFFTAKDKKFLCDVLNWVKGGVAEEWCQSPSRSHDQSVIRYRGADGMTAIPKSLAKGLDIRLSKQVIRIRKNFNGLEVNLDSGEKIKADSILLTPPVPQSLALLDEGGYSVPLATRAKLEKITYDPCIVVMAILDGPSKIQPPGFIEMDGGPISWIADNRVKGISPNGGGVTIHGSSIFSRSHWDENRKIAGARLIEAASEWLGAEVLDYQVHGWRYSRPVHLHDEPFLLLEGPPPLMFAGDAFCAPRVEGAALSGLAAATRLLDIA